MDVVLVVQMDIHVLVVNVLVFMGMEFHHVLHHHRQMHAHLVQFVQYHIINVITLIQQNAPLTLIALHSGPSRHALITCVVVVMNTVVRLMPHFIV